MNTVVLGAGPVGLVTAVLLAHEGHRVTVLDRDAGAPEDRQGYEAGKETGARGGGDRPGVGQFRQPHLLLPRGFRVLADEIPDAVEALLARGGAEYNMLGGAWSLPAIAATGGRRPGDERFATVSARRPVIESALAAVADRTPGVTVRRGRGGQVVELLTGTARVPGRPHVAGVLTGDGEAVQATLVVDAGGRNSPVPKMLADIGAPRPEEEREESGFIYYSRYFRPAGGGAMPAQAGWPLAHHDSVSTLNLPAGAGVWSVTLVVSGRDRALRALREPGAWHRAVALYPHVARCAEAGEPLTGVLAFSGTESRRRGFLSGDRPVATGLLSVGDAWAATNPTFGLGLSMGLVHAAMLRDTLRGQGRPPGQGQSQGQGREQGRDRDGGQGSGRGDADPEKLALRFDEATREALTPTYEALVHWNGHRMAQIDGDIAGTPYETDDPVWLLRQAVEAVKLRDPDLLRAMADLGSLLAGPEEALIESGLGERAHTLAAGAPRYPEPGPARPALLSAIGAS